MGFLRILLALSFVLILSPASIDGYRILGIFPLQGKSHWVMMEPLMKALAARGHQVDVVTHFPLKKPVPNYREISIAGSMPDVINNVTAEDTKQFTGANMKTFAYIAGENLCNLLNLPQLQDIIKNPPTDPPYDIFITEIFVAPCFLAFGRHLKVPTVGVATCSLLDWLNGPIGNPLNTAFQPSVFSMYTQNMSFWERVMNTFMVNYLVYQINYFTANQDAIVRKAFGEDIPTSLELYKELSLVLVNSHHSLNGIRPKTAALVEVGGLHLHDDNTTIPPAVQKWLDDSKDGCIYFTFGSMVRIETFPKRVQEILFESFRKIAPVRVLMKVARKEDLIPGLPENVMIQPWFPQIPILKHKNVRAFITHGGLMGTLEAIYCGVPMIGMPIFGDQHVNVNIYVRKGVAISLGPAEKINEPDLTKALKEIIHNPKYRENVKRLSREFLDRPMSALDTAVYWVEYVGRNGNALQSPAIHLAWWQLCLLDVYGLAALVVVIVLYIALLIARKLKNCLFGAKACAKRHGAATSSKKNK